MELKMVFHHILLLETSQRIPWASNIDVAALFPIAVTPDHSG